MSQVHGFWQPYHLYTHASPYPRLYVEVDAVQGSEPSDATLNKLREFLTTHCQKPEGVEIVRSDVIPTTEAKGIVRKSLAYKFFSGPPQPAPDQQPAVMYVLFYDGALCDQPAPSETQQTRKKSSERKQLPHVELLPYPAAIFINTRYGPPRARDEVLLHEAGHLLGLVRRSKDASDNHCANRTCFMNPTLSIYMMRLLLGRDPIKQHRLCEQCLAELAAISATPSTTTNLRFAGPVLVRSETGYHVLSLPSRVRLVVGDLAEQDCHNFAATVRNETPPAAMNEYRADGFVKDALVPEPAKLREIIARVQNDPFAPVREMGSKLAAAIEASPSGATSGSGGQH
jgi:hypothetical protein